MSIRAMVMAAGAGTRLRPLTDHVPKPMVPVANRPVLEYTLLNLVRHGITDIILNLHSHPSQIKDYFQDGSRFGVRLQYSHERKLMGTAGGVRKAGWFLKSDTFLITSGDGLTDIDYQSLVEYHQRKKSFATMALKRVDSKFDYGITLTKSNGRIRRFIEKPFWGDFISNQVNTGIYVFNPALLSMISSRRIVDFGGEIWPKLLARKKPIFAQATEKYWCDVGSLQEYQRAQRDFLDRKIDFPLPGKEIRPGIFVEEGAVIDPGARLVAPCLIGRSSRIARGARIGPHVVIGHSCRIGAKAVILTSTLWNHVRVESGSRLEGCIVSHNTRVPSNTTSYGGILQ